VLRLYQQMQKKAEDSVARLWERMQDEL
jgi:hypothetical protein